MLHIDKPKVRRLLLTGNFGLEKEMLRVTADGRMAHTPHPFADDEHITRDFCENQTEINTAVFKSADEVVGNLYDHTRRIQQRIAKQGELLWPFSNPPYIRDEEDIPVAQFEGGRSSKTAYRNYLSDRYGRYKMTLSGIHFNYSFSGDLLRQNYEVETGFHVKKGEETAAYRAYESRLYLDLAERLVSYGWIMTVLTAASPILDPSFFEQGKQEKNGATFVGMASVRCSELGYWNAFTPELDYSSIGAYADSIQHYVDKGWIKAPSELYYPIRLKPRGANRLETLREQGVNHIELRMIDLNPLRLEGIDVRDVKFAQLLLVWLAATPRQPITSKDQMQAIANFKNAAHYDLRTVKIVMPDGEVSTAAEAALKILGSMRNFFLGIDATGKVMDVLDYQYRKITSPEDYRYAWIVKRVFSEGFKKKGLQLCANYSALAAESE